MADQKSSESFTDFSSFQHKVDGQISLGSNVLKNFSKYSSGAFPDHTSGSGEEPRIIVHQNGDTVAKIEFICHCGKTAAILFENIGE